MIGPSAATASFTASADLVAAYAALSAFVCEYAAYQDASAADNADLLATSADSAEW